MKNFNLFNPIIEFWFKKINVQIIVFEYKDGPILPILGPGNTTRREFAGIIQKLRERIL